jgi:molybdate transport system substrate-binding protein
LIRRLLFFILYLHATLSFADKITVAVATNFKPSIELLAQQFETNSHHRVKIISASTGMLYNQISNGAPYDILLAADALRPKMLEQRGLAVNGSRFTYAIGQLAFLYQRKSPAPAQNKHWLSKQLKSPNTKIAIANPKLAPYGVASQQVLQHLNLWNELSGQLVRCTNAAQCFQFIHTANAKHGFVALAHVKIKSNTLPYWIIPSAWYQPIRQQAILLQSATNKIAAKEFLDFLQSPAARQMISSHGYLLSKQ